ncbi:MAG: protein BatD [Chitinophagaceae bacterium]|nr:MAG: protein BatD [Chitinophagaceae bacterium]
MRFIQLIFFTSLLLLELPAWSQIRFTASVFPEEVGVGDYVTLKYTIEGSTDIRHIYPPDFKNLQLVSGPDSESGKLTYNGKVIRKFTLSFVLKPGAPGKINLAAARAMIGEKEYSSNEVSITVLKESAAATMRKESASDEVLWPDENIDKKVSDNMVLRLETNKKEVYVGEPVVAEFKLYSRLRSNSRLTQNPSFNGFSVVDLQAPDVTESATGKLNGKTYNVYSVRKVLLYPLQPGTFTIEELELENQVQFIQPQESQPDPYDLFSMLNRGYGNTVSKLVTLATDPVDIRVKPLPNKNKPTNFTGAVGSYKINCRLQRNEFRADEEGRLFVDVSGEGNLQLVNAPEINWPAQLEAFDPTVIDAANGNAGAISGKKTFEYVFSATRPGSYVIPAVSFSYFDAESGRYVVDESAPIMFKVAPSLAAVQSIQTSPAAKAGGKFDPVWLLIPAAGAALLLLFFIFRNLRSEQKPTVAEEEVEVKQFTESPLERSAQLCAEGDSKNFYPALNHELKSWLLTRFCLEANEASLHHLRECMDEANVPNSTVLKVQNLLREIEWQLYAPAGEGSAMQEHYTRASLLVKELSN